MLNHLTHDGHDRHGGQKQLCRTQGSAIFGCSVALVLLTLMLCMPRTVLAEQHEATSTANSIYEFSPHSISGTPVPLSQYKGKVLLIVNTASKCGFTPQYHDLEALYKQYKDRGLEILAFPSNDFANQEPGSDSEIKKFCTLNYGITFPLFARGSVSGSNKQPLFKYLTADSGNKFEGEIKWNFEKFVIDRQGALKTRFGSYINPQSQRVKSVVEELLGQKSEKG